MPNAGILSGVTQSPGGANGSVWTADSTQPGGATYTPRSGLPALVAYPRSGYSYASYLPYVTYGNTALGNGVLCGTVIEFGKPCTLSALLGKAVVAGGTGSVVRMGVYTVDPILGVFGTLVVDAGTYNSTSTADQSLTVLTALGAGAYWLVAVSQGAPTGDPQLRCNNGPASTTTISDGWLGNPSGTPFSIMATGLSTTGITGALPVNLAAATYTQQGKSYIVNAKVA